MQTSILVLVLFSMSPSMAEPTPGSAPITEEQSRDIDTLIAEIAEAPQASPVRSRLCADARTSTRDIALPAPDLERLRTACPSWFPLPAEPDFCLTTGCVSDFVWAK